MLVETIEAKKEMLAELLENTSDKKAVYKRTFEEYQKMDHGYDEWVDFAAATDTFGLAEKNANLKDFLKELNSEEVTIVHTLMWTGLQKSSVQAMTPQEILDGIGIGADSLEWESKDEELDFLISKPKLHDYLLDGLECIGVSVYAS